MNRNDNRCELMAMKLSVRLELRNQGQVNDGAGSVVGCWGWGEVTSRRHHRLRPPAPLSNRRRRLSNDGLTRKRRIN